MKYIRCNAKLLDKATESKRRSRHILANSGQIMESNEVRDLDNLYVMGYDGELYRIADLAKNPEKQTERYAVKAQADHGEVVDDYLVPTIEKQFGSCKVWLEADGLHAQMYFADGDQLADHAWAISEDASYSTGIDWYPDGYEGANNRIDEPIGILREISMVLTGNDPRAKTIDHKQASKAQGREAAVVNNNKEKIMKKKLDELTVDERAKLGEELANILDRFTADVPESETQPTAESKDEAPAEEAEKKEEKKDAHMPMVIVRDRVSQPKVTVTDQNKDWLTSKEGHEAFAKCLKAAGRFGASFDGLWRNELSKHMSLDGITGLPTPAGTDRIFETALETSDGIISHFDQRATKSLIVNVLDETTADKSGRAAGHTKGQNKQNQQLTDNTRNVLNRMIYKRLDIDAMELYENPELIDFRAKELIDRIIVEIERSAIIGDGRSTGTPDLRTFDGTRGFFSVKADAAASSGIGKLLASTVKRTNGDGKNLYELMVEAKGQFFGGRGFVVAKSSAITGLLTAKNGDSYVVAPGSRIEDILDVLRVYTPAWMEQDDANDAYLIADKAYVMTGEAGFRTHAEFDTLTNADILLAESPRGGSLTKFKSAVAIQSEPGE